MVQRNFVMISSRGCTEQKRKQPLSCNSTEGQMLLAKNGRIFDTSVIHCRIDLPTYWFTVVSSISVKNEELPMSNVLQFYRMTYKTYDMQEYIFVHPEERFTRKPLFGIFCFILSRLATSSTLISNLLTLSVQTSPFCASLCFAFWFSALTFATLIYQLTKVRLWARQTTTISL